MLQSTTGPKLYRTQCNHPQDPLVQDILGLMDDLAPEMQHLEAQLCFSLYAASRAMTARYRPLLNALGITYPQYLLLLVLWEQGPSSIKELSSRLPG